MTTLLFDAIKERGYETLTDVQQAVTASEIQHSDLLVSAQTGSGKTVGFGLAIAPTLLGENERFERAASPLALVIAPTRELAMQVARELEWLYEKTGMRLSTCIGGMDARNERRSLERGAHIVVGTPGRLRDHITRGALDLSDIKAIVLDEADEMLDLGFREDLEFMLGEAPETRRTLLFSATVSKSITQIAQNYQKDAVRISTVSEKKQHSDISYQVVQVSPRDSENAIINLLRYYDAPTSIVFANTRAAVARLTARFANRGFSVVSLSGELSQDERTHALQALRDGRSRVCVATDVAARGIDLPNLELVIHADIPTNTEGLLHRSGRTGRAGRKGVSALITTDKASNKVSRLLKWAKIDAEWTYAPNADEILALDEKRLIEDDAWKKDLSAEEQEFAKGLLEQYSPEQIAVSCLRLYRAGLSAPEELGAKPTGKAKDVRESFGPSAWVTLSVGRNEGAEPRWLIPLICREANLTKADIGKIKMEQRETFVEIKEEKMAAFLDELGPKAMLEDEISVKRVAGAPKFSDSKPQRRGGRKFGDDQRNKSFDKRPDSKPKKRDEAVHSSAKPAKKPRKKGTDVAGVYDSKSSDRNSNGKPGGKRGGPKGGGSSAEGARPRHKPHRKGGNSAPVRRK